MTIKIPGTKIDSKTSSITIRKNKLEVFKNNRDDFNVFNSLKNDKLISPIVHAHLPLTINPLLYVNTLVYVDKREIEVDDFEFYYNHTFNNDGTNQLVLFIVYEKNREKIESVEELDMFSFEISFSEGFLIIEPGIRAVDAKTVQVFLVNTNPKTSRGTVTTVQSGG